MFLTVNSHNKVDGPVIYTQLTHASPTARLFTDTTWVKVMRPVTDLGLDTQYIVGVLIRADVRLTRLTLSLLLPER